MGLARLTGDGEMFGLEPHERDKARSRCLTTIGAIAEPRVNRLRSGLVAQRTAQAAAGDGKVAHTKSLSGPAAFAEA